MDGMEQIRLNSQEPSNSGFLSQQHNAIQLLIGYQDEILDLFKQYQLSNSSKIKHDLKSRIYLNLAIYAQIEDEVFYPAIKTALIEKGLLPELQLTFDPLVELILQIDFQNPDTTMHDHNIVDLEKYFNYYVQVQREEMFVKAEKLGLNMEILGQKIYLHKIQLLN